MKTILVDLNVLLDFLFEREGYEAARAVISMCDLKQISGFLCSHEITTYKDIKIYFVNTLFFLPSSSPDALLSYIK